MWISLPSPLNMVTPLTPSMRVVSSLLTFHLQPPHLAQNPFQTDARTQNSSRFIDIDPPKSPNMPQLSSPLDYVYATSKTPLNQSRLCHCDIESLIREQRFHLKPPPIPTHDGLPWYGFSKLTLPVYHPRSLLTLETYLFFRLQNFTTRQNFTRTRARTQAYEFAWTKHCPLQLFSTVPFHLKPI